MTIAQDWRLLARLLHVLLHHATCGQGAAGVEPTMRRACRVAPESGRFTVRQLWQMCRSSIRGSPGTTSTHRGGRRFRDDRVRKLPVS